MCLRILERLKFTGILHLSCMARLQLSAQTIYMYLDPQNALKNYKKRKIILKNAFESYHPTTLLSIRLHADLLHFYCPKHSGYKLNTRILMASKMSKEKQLKENILHRMMFFGLLMLFAIFTNYLDHIDCSKGLQAFK